MKFDTYKTMTTWVKACQENATPEDPPFCLVIENPDKISYDVGVCATSHQLVILTENLMRTLIDCLKQSIVESKKDEAFEVIASTLGQIVLKELMLQFPDGTLTLMKTFDDIKKIFKSNSKGDDE